jgi:phosphonate transport system permease protein
MSDIAEWFDLRGRGASEPNPKVAHHEDVTLAEAQRRLSTPKSSGTSVHRTAPQSTAIAARKGLVLLAVAATLLWTGFELGIGQRTLVNGSGFNELFRFAKAAVHPKVSASLATTTLDATLITLAYAALGTVLSVFVGLLFGVLSTRARNDAGRITVVGRLIRVLAIPIRGTHEFLWALILVNILGINPLVAIIAIALPFGAVSTRVFAELFEAQDRAPFVALRASGAGRWQAFFYGIFPAASRDLSSYAFYRFECAIRAAAVLGIVGAGGLGYQLNLSFISSDYREMWTFLWPLIALSAGADALSSTLRRSARALKHPSMILVAMVAAAGLAWFKLHVHISSLWSQRTRKEFSFVIGSWLPADWSKDHLSQLWPAARQTVAISIGSIAVSLLIAFPLALLTARVAGQRRTRRAASWLGRTVLLIARAIPPAVWAFLVVLVLFPGPLPAAVALGVYNAGVLGRLLAEVVENLDQRPRRALRAAGASPMKANVYATIPQASPSFTTYTLYRWEVAMRETIVVGVAAAGGLGAHLKQLLAAFAWNKVVAAVVVLLIITALVDVTSGALRRRLLL